MKKVKRRETEGRPTRVRFGLVPFSLYLRLRLPISTFSMLGQAHSRNPNIDRQQRVVAAATSKNWPEHIRALLELVQMLSLHHSMVGADRGRGKVWVAKTKKDD